MGTQVVIATKRSMSEVVGEMGIVKPNCDGLDPVDFVTELAIDSGDGKNNAKKICEGCESREKCPVNLGTTSLSSILLTESGRSEPRQV